MSCYFIVCRARIGVYSIPAREIAPVVGSTHSGHPFMCDFKTGRAQNAHVHHRKCSNSIHSSNAKTQSQWQTPCLCEGAHQCCGKLWQLRNWRPPKGDNQALPVMLPLLERQKPMIWPPCDEWIFRTPKSNGIQH